MERTGHTGGDETLAGTNGASFETAPLEHGDHLGRYIVLETLGSGGMGHVFSAFDTVLQRNVALKVLRRVDDEDRTRLVREAQAMAKLSHPNVVPVFDVGEVEGQVFLAMELVPGCTLRHWLRQPGRTVEQMVEAFRGAARGLQAAHEAGIVHRDFKPDNVLVGLDGRVRVTDFGLAITATDKPTLQPITGPSTTAMPERLTESGTVMGTPAYMPVEQHLGQMTDPRGDQFSFCVALYEALFRARPFAGRNGRELCISIKRAEVRPAPRSLAPAHVHAAILRGLASRPEDRFASMAALLDALEAPPPKRRRTGLLMGLAGVALGAVAMASVGPAATHLAPRLVETSMAQQGLGPALVGLEHRAMQRRVAARRASTAADCETAFEYDLGARVLCLDGLNAHPRRL